MFYLQPKLKYLREKKYVIDKKRSKIALQMKTKVYDEYPEIS